MKGMLFALLAACLLIAGMTAGCGGGSGSKPGGVATASPGPTPTPGVPGFYVQDSGMSKAHPYLFNAYIRDAADKDFEHYSFWIAVKDSAGADHKVLGSVVEVHHPNTTFYQLVINLPYPDVQYVGPHWPIHVADSQGNELQSQLGVGTPYQLTWFWD